MNKLVAMAPNLYNSKQTRRTHFIQRAARGYIYELLELRLRSRAERTGQGMTVLGSLLHLKVWFKVVESFIVPYSY